MLEKTNAASGGGLIEKAAQRQNTGQKVLKMVKNERMGGSMPVWERAATPRQSVEERLTSAKTGQDASFREALAYNESAAASPHRAQAQEFGFGDLVDMVNPLHHIPVVGHIYRGVTGDEIKPIGNIIGGAVFGGPAGAAGGLVNAVVEKETGRDVAGNAISMLTTGRGPDLAAHSPLADTPEGRLNRATTRTSLDELPGNLLAFSDLGGQSSKNFPAGHSGRPAYPVINESALPPREPITEVSLSFKRRLNN